MKRTNLLLILFLGILCANLSFAQSKDKCKVSNSLKGKFKVVFEARPVGNPDELILDVVIKPKNHNTEFLRDFVIRMDRTYCNVQVLWVSIFESKKDAPGWHYDYVTSGRKIDRRRGTFILDRTCGKENLEYATARGRPIDEVKIDNSKIFGECRRH